MLCQSCGAAIDAHGRHLPPSQPDGFTAPSLATDALVLRTGSEGCEVLLIRRGQDPNRGCLALPGGFVEYGEDPKDCVLRELVEETGLKGRNPRHIWSSGHPLRDSRKHVVSLIYLVDAPADTIAIAGDDAAEIVWTRIDELPGVDDESWSFDHGQIIHDALQHPWVIGQGVGA